MTTSKVDALSREVGTLHGNQSRGDRSFKALPTPRIGPIQQASSQIVAVETLHFHESGLRDRMVSGRRQRSQIVEAP